MYIDVYKGDDNFVTSVTSTLLSDLDLQETYRAIDSVATGRIPSLVCGKALVFCCCFLLLPFLFYFQALQSFHFSLIIDIINIQTYTKKSIFTVKRKKEH